MAKVRAHLRTVSRSGHSHAVSMWAWPDRVPTWCAPAGGPPSASCSAGRAARYVPATSSRSMARARGVERGDGLRGRAGIVGGEVARAARRAARKSSQNVAQLALHDAQLGAGQREQRGTVGLGHEQRPLWCEPHGGFGLAAASTIEVDRARRPRPRRVRRYSRWLGERPCIGRPPSHTSASAPKPVLPAPPSSKRSATSSPAHPVGIVPRSRNHVVSHAGPHRSPTANGS